MPEVCHYVNQLDLTEEAEVCKKKFRKIFQLQFVDSELDWFNLSMVRQLLIVKLHEVAVCN